MHDSTYVRFLEQTPRNRRWPGSCQGLEGGRKWELVFDGCGVAVGEDVKVLEMERRDRDATL